MTKLAIKEVYREGHIVIVALRIMQVFECNANVISFPEQELLILKENFISEPFCAVGDAIVILCEKPFPLHS